MGEADDPAARKVREFLSDDRSGRALLVAAEVLRAAGIDGDALASGNLGVTVRPDDEADRLLVVNGGDIQLLVVHGPPDQVTVQVWFAEDAAPEVASILTERTDLGPLGRNPSNLGVEIPIDALGTLLGSPVARDAIGRLFEMKGSRKLFNTSWGNPRARALLSGALRALGTGD